MAQSNNQKVLRIGLIHNGQIIEEKLMRHGKNISIGKNPKNDLLVRLDAFPDVYPLFYYKSDGYYLNFSTSADGKLSRGDDLLDFKELVSQGLAKPNGKSHLIKVSETDRGKLKIGDLSLVFQFITPPPPAHLRYPTKLKANFFDMIDWFFASMFLFSFILQSSVIGYFTMNFDPIAYEKKHADMSTRFVEILKIEKPKPPEIKPEKKIEEKKKPENNENKAENTEPVEKISEQDLPPPTTPENKEIRKTYLTQKVQSNTVLKFLVSSDGGETNIVGELSGEASKTAISEAFKGAGLAVADGNNNGQKRDSAMGSETGKTMGIDESKIAGSNGARKAVTTGQIQERAVSGKLKIDNPSETAGSGSLSSAKIQETVNRRSGALKGCYESELKKDDSLQGKIKVQFTIEPSGRVGAVKVVENTINSVVGQCVVAQIQRWRFPAPEGGEVTIVYPFVFSSSR